MLIQGSTLRGLLLATICLRALLPEQHCSLLMPRLRQSQAFAQRHWPLLERLAPPLLLQERKIKTFCETRSLISSLTTSAGAPTADLWPIFLTPQLQQHQVGAIAKAMLVELHDTGIATITTLVQRGDGSQKVLDQSRRFLQVA